MQGASYIHYMLAPIQKNMPYYLAVQNIVRTFANKKGELE